MENAFQNLTISADEENAASGDPKEGASNSLAGMSNEEVELHQQLCLKLSAENKINSKNAFGLHLISILPHLVKGPTDLQFASISLQASSKIYAGRVDALYKETCQFHGHLQAFVGGKKDVPRDEDPENFEEEVEAPKDKRSRNKCKSYLASSEESITSTQAKSMSKPFLHGNFIPIKSAFSGCSVKNNLLYTLPFESDACSIKCTKANNVYQEKQSLSEVMVTLIKGIKEKLGKIKLNVENFSHFPDHNRTARTADVFSDVDSIVHGCENMSFDGGEPGVNHTAYAERNSVFHITADAFVNDVSQAITCDGKGLDERLLPPQSALKKVLKASERTRLPNPVTTTKKREKKIRVPFFASEEDPSAIRTFDIALFAEGKKTILSEKTLREWSLSGTTMLDLHDHFDSDLNNMEIGSVGNSTETEELLYLDKIFLSDKSELLLKNGFHKRCQPWQEQRRSRTEEISNFRTRPSSLGQLRRPSAEMPNQFSGLDENLVTSMQHLTLIDSAHDDLGYNHIPADDLNDDHIPDDVNDDSFGCGLNNSLNKTVHDDVQLMMVTPPALVKPLNIKYQHQPIKINTDEVKKALWKIIATKLDQDGVDSILLSTAHQELEEQMHQKHKSENISLQYIFVMLLILANQQTLRLTNLPGNKDIIIERDVLETMS